MNEVQSAIAHPEGAPVVEVDVRDDLRSGREPFAKIMSAVDSLEEGAVLHLRAIFEPAPLFRVLGKRGFVHESQAHAPDDWSVWFWRRGAIAQSSEYGDGGDGDSTNRIAGAFVNDPTTTHLDVRGLNPPEPMLRTLAALDTLPPGHTLVQVNVRVPQFLLPALVERGFAWEVDESVPDRVLVRIRHAQQSHPSSTTTDDMSTTIRELDVRVIPPRDKHPTIFRTFDELAAGQSMVIVNDHDPRPLKYQFQAERAGKFGWTYEAEGPEVWRVRIDRI